MAILRLRHTDKRPADGQAVQLVNIDGLPGGGGSSISSAEATTLEAGEEATAEIDGGVLKLGIPKGDAGETGPQGPQGAAGAAGAAATVSVGSVSTLDAGEEATVSNAGTSSAAVFDFGIPKGEKGDTGEAGPAGAAGAAGADGAGVAKITLTVEDGAVTGGTWEDTDGESHTIEIESS